MTGDSLAAIEAGAWVALTRAAGDPQSGFRQVTLCTVDAGGQPQARMVVLRQASADLRMLEFHTDIRSPKWAELAAGPRATVLGYCPATRLQLRLRGTITRHAPESPLARTAWESLPPWTRSTYAGGPPGDELAFAPAPPATESDMGGHANFGVLHFTARDLDWFQLQRQDNRRALFRYDGTRLSDANWIAP